MLVADLVEKLETDFTVFDIFNKHFYLDLGFTEIGRMLDIAESTVRKKWNVALTILRKHIAEFE